MVEEGSQLREEGANVEPSLVSLSRKCSNCGQTGHNSRTCLEIREHTTSEAEHKSTTADSINTSARIPQTEPLAERATRDDDAEVSDCSADVSKEAKKKGVAWTEEEHKLFLKGLQKLGKGDWRGISRQFVQTRSPTQVASHAQKYFIRQSVVGKRKRRSSLFDLVPEGSQELKETAKVQATARSKEAVHTPSPACNDGERPVAGAVPPMPQGAEALAFAYWYQNMLLQQGSLAWMQALYGMQTSFSPNQSLHSQGLHLADQGGTSLHPLPHGLTQDRQLAFANMAAHQQAAAMFAQQQLSALAMGSIGYGPNAAEGLHGTPFKSNNQDASKLEWQEKAENQSVSMLPQQSFQRGAIIESNRKSLRQRYEQTPAEVFGNGKLVRPKAHRVQSGQSLVSMHGYIRSQSSSQAQVTTCSKDSQDSLALLASISGMADPSSYTGTGGNGSVIGFGASNGVEKSAYTGGAGSVGGFGVSYGDRSTSEGSRTFRHYRTERA